MADLLANIIDRIDNAAARPQDDPKTRLRKTLLIFLSVFAVSGGACGALFAGGFAPSLQSLLTAYALGSAAGLVFLLAAKRYEPVAWLQLAAVLLVPLRLHWDGGGFGATGGAVLWALVSPLAALVLVSDRAAVGWFVAYLGVVFAAAVRDLLAAGGDPGLNRGVLLFAENAAVLSSIVFISMRFFIQEREKTHQALVLEQEKSERLLLNILPKPIADRLKDSGETIADGFAEATVLFADIVGFTPLSATLSPAALVAVLNELFSGFDRIAATCGVEKIKTIGDAYMVCAGLPEPAADHAERIAEMALGMREVVERFNRDRGLSLRIRIGVNSGPVVAGVIGLKKFIYDLWGDTVNTASRMESHGQPGEIQVTAATYALLKEKYSFKDRGEIEVKGLGRLRAYLLTGRVVPR